VAARLSTYKKLDKRSALYQAKREIGKAKARVRIKVEHPFQVIKRQFGYVKTRFCGLAKNTAQLVTLLPCQTCGWRADICWRMQERCVCNTRNGCCEVLAVAKNSEMSG